MQQDSSNAPESPATAVHPLEGWLVRNKGAVPSRRAAADLLGVSGGRLTQILAGEQPSPELAIKIHHLTNGEVPGSLLRPDIWRNAGDVPPPIGADDGEAARC